MKSTHGQYYPGLDHIRALAAFLVFCWHFLHIRNGQETPLPGTFEVFTNSLFAEGHTGVSIFMVLSGYLFARITHNKSISYPIFLYNRAVRLSPLLLATIAVHPVLWAIDGQWRNIVPFLRHISLGVIAPVLPNGGWSITVEAHFYLVFPLVLWLEKRFPPTPWIILGLALAGRSALYFSGLRPHIQDVAYWTIAGRIDQFMIGILFARSGEWWKGRHWAAGAAVVAVFAFYHWFDRIGGFYMNTKYPGVWVWMLSLEGGLYGVVICVYEQSAGVRAGVLSSLLGKIGEWSYSIYLLHFFFVFRMANYIDQKIVPLDNFYTAFLFAIPCFALICVPAAISYEFYEKFFLRFRKRYLRE